MTPPVLLLRKVLVISSMAFAFACGGAAPDAPVRSVGATAWRPPPFDFSFESLDERPVSSTSMRGKVSVIAFVTTQSLPAQAQVDYLVAMAKHDADATNYAIVALDTDAERTLVEVYGKSLSVPFPIALADAATRAGSGPFGALVVLPVIVVLDPSGRVAFRADGRVVRSEELRAAMRAL